MDKPMYKFASFKEAYEKSREYNSAGKMADFPPYVTFELTTGCNFKCIMCRTGYLERRHAELKYGIFKRAVDEIGSYGSLIRFIGYCEPLLFSRIREAIRYVKDKGLLLHITTNGSLLNSVMIKSIVESKTDCVIFSFQGLSEKEYCFMRNVSAEVYHKIIQNIKSLYKNRKDGKPYIKLTTTITERDDIKNKDKFIEDHLKYADEVQITGFTHFIPLEREGGKTDIWDSLSIKRPREIGKVSCFIPNYEVIIRPNADVYPCCGAYGNDFVIGNITKNSLSVIWHSKRAAEIREAVADGRLEKFQGCGICPIRYEYKDISNTVLNTMGRMTENFLNINS